MNCTLTKISPVIRAAMAGGGKRTVAFSGAFAEYATVENFIKRRKDDEICAMAEEETKFLEL